ncbi:hypothetical protein AAHE18_02G108800 [Arachis hypogaea]
MTLVEKGLRRSLTSLTPSSLVVLWFIITGVGIPFYFSLSAPTRASCLWFTIYLCSASAYPGLSSPSSSSFLGWPSASPSPLNLLLPVPESFGSCVLYSVQKFLVERISSVF